MKSIDNKLNKKNIYDVLNTFTRIILKIEIVFSKTSRFSLSHMLVIGLCLLFIFAAILVNVNRFWQYESGYYDLGIFDTAIWKISRFQAPIIDHLIVGGKWIFADHFSPSFLFLCAPFYWFTDKTEVLFIVQDVSVGVSGYFLYLIAGKILKKGYASLAITTSYLFFIGLQNAIIFDVHELTVMTVFLVLTYWAIFNKKYKLFLLFFFITIGFKDTLFLLGIGLSVFVYFTHPQWRKTAIYTLIASIIWGISTILFIIPFFSGGIYIYKPEITNGFFDVIKKLIYPFLKIKSVFASLFSFLFLPILNPPILFILFLNFSARFLTKGAEHWDMGLHYNAEIAPTLAIGAILGLRYLQSKLSNNMILLISIAIIVNSIFLHRFIFRGPLALAYNPDFYKHTSDFKFLNNMIQSVPKNVSVLAQNNIAVRFTHQQVWLLKADYAKYDADYIIFDLRPGQNPYHIYMSEESMKTIFDEINNNSRYQLHYSVGDQYIFKKKNLTKY